MIDERIQTTVNRIAARAFFIWFVLMMISFNYRLLILKQNPGDLWDFIAIFFGTTFFVFIEYARNGVLENSIKRSSKGVLDNGFKRLWLPIGIIVPITIIITLFFMGKIHSIVDMCKTLGGALLGIFTIIGIALFLNWCWKRKAGIEDEK